MRKFIRRGFFLLAPIFILLFLSGLLAAQSGGDFDLSWSTVDGGGGSSQGASYSMSGTIGQPDTARLQGGPFDLQGGFWGGTCPAPGPVNPGIALVGGNVQLAWTAVPGATHYNIYREINNPYFPPQPPNLYDTTGSSPWTDPDPNVSGDPALNHYYVVRAANSCGDSPASLGLGVFNLPLVPGT